MGYFIFALILFIIAGILYIINDNREQRLFEELTGQNKTTEQEPEKERREPKEPIEPEEPKTEYREPHLKSDPEIQKWLYIYDGIEQLKRENNHLKDEIKEIHSKLTLVWIFIIFEIVIAVLSILAKGAIGVGAVKIISNLL